jgi:hypothetical protein
LWLRLASAGASMHYTRRALVNRRVHPSGLSGTPAEEIERALAVLTRAAESLPLSPPEKEAAELRQSQLRAALLCERAKESLASRDFSAARKSLSQANTASPSWKLRAALVGLRVAPRLVGAIVDARNRRGERPAPMCN